MDPIIVTDLNITGRVTERDTRLGNVFVTYNMDFSSTANYVFQFGIQSQMQTFGVVKSLFLDNGSNPNDVEVAVTGTDQFFTVPAYSIGIYTVDANQGSNINVVTTGGATDICTITFYNWERPPVVWYSFGAFNSDAPIKAYGTMAEGDTVASEQFKEPLYIGGIDRGTGQFRGIKVDAQGRLDFASTITIGAVTIADGADVALGATTDAAVTNPATNGTVISYLRGLLTRFNANLNSLASEVTAAAILTRLDVNLSTVATEATLDAIRDVTVAQTTTGTLTAVASNTSAFTLLAANANRRGASIVNSSNTTLRISLSATNPTTTLYTVQLLNGAYYEVPFGYTGIIKGICDAVVDSVNVTEYT
jgi:hypothetical protein